VRQAPKKIAEAAPAAPAPSLPAGMVVLSGKVRPQEVIEVGAEVNGNVDAFLADVGQEVEEGQILARISNQGLETAREVATTALSTAQARVSKLEATLMGARMEASRADAEESRTRTDMQRAERAYQRQKMLLGEGATPRLVYEKSSREYEAVQSEFVHAGGLAKQARAQVAGLMEQAELARKIVADRTRQLENAQSALLSAEVHAPVDGFIVGRRGEVGKPVEDAGGPLFEITPDTALLQVTLEPEPPVLQRVRPGMEALVSLPELQSEPIAGAVKGVEGTVVLVDFTSPNPAIKPGMPAEVRLKLE
jgi:HlyD family secretion protein